MAFATDYTTTDLTNITAAIRDIIAGERVVSLSLGDKSISFTNDDLPRLRALRDEVKYELGLADGSYATRTYAKNAGRGR